MYVGDRFGYSKEVEICLWIIKPSLSKIIPTLQSYHKSLAMLSTYSYILTSLKYVVNHLEKSTSCLLRKMEFSKSYIMRVNHDQ